MSDLILSPSFSSSFIKVIPRALERWVTERYPLGKKSRQRKQAMPDLKIAIAQENEKQDCAGTLHVREPNLIKKWTHSVPSIWCELCGAWLMWPWTLAGRKGHRHLESFSVMLLSCGRRLSFLGHLTLLLEDLGDAPPSRSRSTMWEPSCEGNRVYAYATGLESRVRNKQGSDKQLYHVS